MKEKYSSDFKIQIVRETFKHKISYVAKKYEIPESTIRVWVKKYSLEKELAFTKERKSGRKNLNEKTKRNKLLQIRLNDFEYNKLLNKYLHYKENPSNVSMSEVFRNILLNKKVNPSPYADPYLIDQYVNISNAINKYGNNLNQIIKRGYLYKSFNEHEKNVIIENIKNIEKLLKQIEEKF